MLCIPFLGAAWWQRALFILWIPVALGLTLYQIDRISLSWGTNKLDYSYYSAAVRSWDFSNLWMGTTLARDHKLETVFDPIAYRNYLKTHLNPYTDSQEWSYPPPMLLVGLPFIHYPIDEAHLYWLVSTWLLLLIATVLTRCSLLSIGLAVLGPTVLVNAMLGQNGVLTVCLLLVGFALARPRPIIAGIFFGMLLIKPHIALLAPIAMLATRNYRAILSAVGTMMLIALATTLVFGSDVWTLYWRYTLPTMQGIMNAPFPQPYHAGAVTVFTLARAYGAAIIPAQIFQWAVTLLTIAVTWKLWRDQRYTRDFTIGFTLILSSLATPYLWAHDLMLVQVGTALMAHRRLPLGTLLIILFLWLLPATVRPWNLAFILPVTPLFIGLACLLLWNHRALWSNPSAPPLAQPESQLHHSKV